MLFSSASAVRQAKSTGLRKRSCFSGRACQRSTATKQGRASPQREPPATGQRCFWRSAMSCLISSISLICVAAMPSASLRTRGSEM